MIEIKIVVVNRVCKTRLPLRKGSKLNLFKAFNKLKKEFDVQYDPPPPTLFVKMDGLTLSVNENGNVMIFSKLSQKVEAEKVKSLWRCHLRHFQADL